MNSFSDFGLLPSIEKTLREKGLTKPTEIQARAIPMMMDLRSVVGISETGSGKTLAYALPILNLLKKIENQGVPVTNERTPRAIVMVPSRELGEQVAKVFKTLTHDTRLRVRSALGGMPLAMARRNVSGPFEILLATPGRLNEMIGLKLIEMNDVQVLIFDEADQMLDPGFLTDSRKIVEACPDDVVMGLFSATVSKGVEDLMKELFKNAEVIRSSGSGKVVKTLTTRNVIVRDGQRWPHFEKILAQKTIGGTLIFVNTRDQVDKLAAEMAERGYECTVYRGEMEKVERRANLKKFRDGEVELLISTDLAARGLDIEIVARVINYHLPQQMENYLHRAGRTARAGRGGLVINLVTPRDGNLMDRLEEKQKGFKKAAAPRPRADDKKKTGSPSKKGQATKAARHSKKSQPRR